MIRFFAGHPTAANLLMIILFAMGIFALPSLKRETFPSFVADEVEVRVLYPGASAEEVEEAICRRVEESIEGVNDIEEVRGEAREGVGIVFVKMKEGGSFDRFLNDVKTEVEAIDTFPDRVETLTVKPLHQKDLVVSVAITGPMSAPDLKFYAEQIKDRMLRLPEISQVEVEGFSDHQIRIELNPFFLKQMSLSVADIANRIQNQSLNLPLGTLETSEQDILIRFKDERRSVIEFEELVVVANAHGAKIRLGEIAQITDRFEQEEQKILFNGERAAVLKITKTRAEDSIKVGDAVEQFIAQEQKNALPGVKFSLTQDVYSIVRDRLQLLWTNGWQGFILVAVVLWLFFSFYFGFWVVMGLPASFLGAFFFMQYFGQSVNMITMVGLLIALGLLMDDAIVISENIATHLRQNKTALEAAIEGTREVQVGVFSSFLTTVCMFGPLVTLQGDIGKVLRVLPVILILTLSVSIIEAFFILPHHLAHSLAHYDPKKQNRFRSFFERNFDWFQENVIGRLADLVVSWRYLFVGLVIATFLCSISMVAGGVLKFKAFPDLDGDIIEARLLLPQGTPLAKTEATVKTILNALNQVDQAWKPKQTQQQSLIKNVQIRYNINADAYETGPHLATIVVDLLTSTKRNGKIDEFIRDWRTQTGDIPGVLHLNFKEPSVGPQGIPIEIRLQGPDLENLQKASFEFQQWLNRYQGIFDVFDDLRPGKPEMRLHLKESALSLGLTAKDVAQQLRVAYYGQTVNEIQIGSESYEVDVRFALSDRNSLADLEYFKMTTPQGVQIPLKTIANLELGRGFARIQRIDHQRTVTIQGDVDSHRLNVNELIQETQQKFLPNFSKKYPEILVVFEGEYKKGKETGGSVRRCFMIGILGVFILLSFQFRSYLEPFTVMLAIPLALIGVIWGHLLMGLPLTMPSMVGFVSLAGVVVNDSILLIEFLKRRSAEGMAIHNAATQASRDRFRAVLLTSLTTIVGMLPLLFEKSFQAQVLIPLVTSLVFGLVASTILVLFVVPALYSIFEDFGLTSSKKESS